MSTTQGTAEPGPDTIELVGGALCLDLANTVEGRGGPDRRDALADVRDVARWSQRAGVLSGDEAEAVARHASSDAASAGRSFARVTALREAIYRVFTAIIEGRPPAEADLSAVQRSHAEGMHHARLAPVPGGELDRFSWRWDVPENGLLELVRWRASESAVDLLRVGRLDRMRQCPGGGDGPCNWLFIDTTRGGNRRWCSMSDCGSRSKWRRQNARRRRGAR